MVEHLLGGADLLDEAVAHDDDAVTKGHGLGLVVGDVDESGVDLLTQLDDLGAHLVTELGVQVGQRLVHEEHLGLTHDGAADGNTLALAAGQSLGLPVEVLGDVQNLGGFLDLAVNLVLGHLLQLQGEGHVLVDRHMGVQGVGLEDHGDVAVLGSHIVHDLAVDKELALADLFQAGHHAQSGGLAAAGGTNQNNKLLIGDVQVELLDGDDAAVGDLKVGLLLGSIALLLLFLLLVAAVGVDLHDVLQGYSCHSSRRQRNCLRRFRLGQEERTLRPITACLHNAAPHAYADVILSCQSAAPFCGVAWQLMILIPERCRSSYL